MIWDEFTCLEIAKVDKKTPVVLVMAANEQHGPHLPFATDRLIGEHFVISLNKSIPDKVLVLPHIAVGCSEHHIGFLGSLTRSHNTFINQVKDIVSSILKHGFTNTILLNNHGENQDVWQVLVEKLGSTYKNLNIVLATRWKFGGNDLTALNEIGPMNTVHAGEFEESLIMLIAPELVRMDKLEKGKFVNVYK
ncbi:creatininase family protein [Arenibacter sp. F26102]|uniref:creatininase family protein n=1 Tax=Arenibacter sp. F26102 TaxID=2926416 RepID=UPI001FF1ED9A|nr:creatininase family protein [Arenibacter sp. F26102]MCK0148257.1 creatininase family protein [Arenibacter sp. F26102]